MPWICRLSSGFPITRPDQHQDLQAARFRATDARPIESTEGGRELQGIAFDPNSRNEDGDHYQL